MRSHFLVHIFGEPIERIRGNRDGLLRGCFAGRDGLGHQAHAERRTDAADGTEARRAVGAKGFVESFAGNSGGLGDLRHAARAGNVPQRRSQPESRSDRWRCSPRCQGTARGRIQATRPREWFFSSLPFRCMTENIPKCNRTATARSGSFRNLKIDSSDLFDRPRFLQFQLGRCDPLRCQDASRRE